MSILPDFVNRSIATRIAIAVLSLLVVIQAATYLILSVVVEEFSERIIEAELTVGKNVLDRLVTQNAERLQLATSVLAADFGFRDAVTSNDVPTIVSALENSSQRIGASVAVLLNPRREYVASAGVVDTQNRRVFEQLAVDIAARDGPVKLGLVAGRPYQFVLLPVRAPTTVGWVLMGFAVAESLAAEVHKLSGVHAAVAWQDATGVLRHVSSLTGLRAEALAELPLAGGKLQLATGEPYRTAVVESASAGGALRVVLLRSVRDAAESLQTLGIQIFVVSLVGAFILALGIAFASRRVTQPLGELTQVTKAMERGQFNVTIDHTQRADEVGKLARGFASMRDSLERQREEITRLAFWDALTGIPNRLQFEKRLREAMEPGTLRSPLAVLTLNLDRFKYVNDVLGHGVGDQVIEAVARRLHSQVARRQDLVARMAGDEFAVMLNQADVDAAQQVATRIARAFAEPLSVAKQTIDVSASIGFAVWESGSSDMPTHVLAERLLKQSEIAMRTAKSRRVGILGFMPDMDSTSATTLSLLTELRRAVAEGELRLYLQPKIDTHSHALKAVEALLRWQHPERGLVPPISFIPFAEQTGYVRELTMWVFDSAAAALPALRKTVPHLQIAINLSTRDLVDADLPSKLDATMRARRVTADAFTLEITESAIMDDPQRSLLTLQRLDAMGFRLSIDDFGTGYSSLAYLKRLPVSELKVDKSFVMAMERETRDRQIVQTIVELAHNLQLSVVAEGVENATSLEMLAAIRCDEAQGYFISRPLPVEAFVEWAKARANVVAVG